jgi:hypothetical protein
MTETIEFEVFYKKMAMDIKIIVHRSWNISRLKHELAFVLNILMLLLGIHSTRLGIGFIKSSYKFLFKLSIFLLASDIS